MKTLTTILVTCVAVAINKCSSSDTRELKENLAIEYQASTRGSQSKLIIKNDSLIVMEEGRKESVNYYPLSNKEWNALVKEVNKIDRDKVKTYKAPTNKRATDAARTTQIKVVYKGEVYESDLFDEGHPPAEIKSLVDKVADLYLKTQKNKK